MATASTGSTSALAWPLPASGASSARRGRRGHGFDFCATHGGAGAAEAVAPTAARLGDRDVPGGNAVRQLYAVSERRAPVDRARGVGSPTSLDRAARLDRRQLCPALRPDRTRGEHPWRA